MKSPAVEVPAATAAVLDRAAAAVAAQESAAVDLLVAAAEWAEAHAVDDPYEAAGWEDKKLRSQGVSSLAGPGTPLIAEFAPLEFGGRLGWTALAAKALIADALELKHRLPRLWALVLEQVVSVRVARRIANCTTDLSMEAAKQADRVVCADPTRIGPIRAERLIDEVRLWFDPDRAIDDEQRALALRGAWKQPGPHRATAEMLLLLDQPDAERFDHSLSQIATALGRLGDTDDLDIRRAKAVGVLADPQRAVEVLRGVETAAQPPASMLFVHITEEALDRTSTGAAPTTVEGLGCVSSDLIREWLSGSTVIVRPVLHMGRTDPVERHDPPAWLRELVIQRDAHCVFPGCRRDSRSCDLDHIEPYDSGGATSAANLAPLCRAHHRAKTHAAFDYMREADGSYWWTLPTGSPACVIPTGRRPIGP